MKQLGKVNNLIISLYLFVMLGFFPLYYRYQYAKMGDEKYKIFLYTSSICIVISFLLCLWNVLLSYCINLKKRPIKKNEIARLQNREHIKSYNCSRPLDFAVIIYFGAVILSFVITDFKEFAWKGADGWFMGLLSQLLFVAVYFFVSKFWTYRPWALSLLGISSALVFIIAVFHRFDVDLLSIYGNLKEEYKVLFLSTMGQSSWYSSFLCTVFPIGLFIFFNERDRKKRTWAGVYSAIAMMSLVTQNTDSAFLSLFGVMMVLFYLSFDGKMKEFMEVLILILASFCFMGVCQKIFAVRMIPLDTMSLFMSQSACIWIVMIAVTGIYLWIYRGLIFAKKKGMKQKRKRTEEGTRKPVSKKIFWMVLAIVLVAFFLMIFFIIVNTNGLLLNIIGYQSTNNYLLFDNQWGNGRGFAWKFAVATFAEMPLLQKLFGVGPDCFSAYAASVPEYLELMKGFWGDLVLTNAHNEYLTKLYNIGVVGLLAYIMMLVTGVRIFIKNRDINSFLPAFALCIVSYMAHNIFCYEQVCCTPFFYIILGIGSNLIHNQIKKSTY